MNAWVVVFKVIQLFPPQGTCSLAPYEQLAFLVRMSTAAGGGENEGQARERGSAAPREVV